MHIVFHIFLEIGNKLELRYKWDIFAEWYKANSKHRRIVLSGSMFCLSLFIVTVYACSGSSKNISDKIWVYNEAIQNLTTLKKTKVDSDTVVAYVYVDHNGNRIIGWLSMGDMIRSVDSKWVKSSSEEGRAIPRTFSKKYEGQIRSVVAR